MPQNSLDSVSAMVAIREKRADAIDELTVAINRLAAAAERIGARLGDPPPTRYTSPPNEPDLVDERTMAGLLNISNRTLGKYRRDSRFPNCWIRNSRRISWKVSETQEAWDRGIA